MADLLKWEVYFGEIFNVKIFCHISTFVFLLLLLMFGGVFAFVITCMAFASIIPHEYGHILAARQYGVKCRRVMILPIGGVALLEEMPRDWRKEMWIAWAGPLVSLGLCLGSLPIGIVFYYILPMVGFWFVLFSLINGFLFVFNLIPAHPLDGGRLLRAFLHRRLSYYDATWYAVRVSQVICVAMGAFMLLTGSIMGVVAMAAVFYMAEQELSRIS